MGIKETTASDASAFTLAFVLALASSGHSAFAALPNLTLKEPHAIADPVYNLPWATVTVPSGWGFNGGMIHANNCQVMGPSALFSGESPDHRFGFIVLPDLKSAWSNEGRSNAQLQAAGCVVSNAQTAEAFLRTVVLPRLAPPGARVDGVAPAPALAPLVQQAKAMNDQLRSSLSVPNMRIEYAVDSAKLLLSFDKGGEPMRGELLAVTSCSDTVMAMPGLNQPLRNIECTALLAGASYAPAGDMDAFDKTAAFKLDVNPAWTEHNNQVQQQIAQQNFANNQQRIANQQATFEAGQRAHAAQMAGYDRYNQAQRQRSNAIHESNQAFAAHMGDYNDYTDPSTGQTLRLSNQMSHTYIGSDGSTVLQTNQAGSPGVDWSLMVPRFK